MKSIKYLFSIVALYFISCTSDSHKSELQRIPVIQVIQRDTTIYKDYIAEIAAVRNIELRARVQGYIDNILIDEAQEVKAGQVLFQINDEEYKASYAEAKAKLNSLLAEAASDKLEVDRLKSLVEKKVLSETELKLAIAKLDAANARIEEAKSALSRASLRLSHTSIKAPFDGRIGRLPFKMGSLIDEGSLLTTVSDDHNVYAYFKVSESEYLDYQKKVLSGGEAHEDDLDLLLADGTHHSHKGRVEVIAGQFESGTGTIAFRAKFSNPNGLLRHGSSGKVRLSIEQRDAVIIPQKSTFEIQDRTYVYIVGPDSVVTMKGFVPKVRFTKFYIVESGLVPGERIVYEGVQNLREKMKIDPEEITSDQIGIVSVRNPKPETRH